MSAKQAKQLPVPFINTGLDDSHVVLKYPKDPVQIGEVVKDGNKQPIWLDPKDLIPTPAQKDEQAHNMKGVAFEANLERARWETLACVEAWLGRCIQSICPCCKEGQPAIVAWMRAQDINYIEDTSDKAQIRFVLRRGDKPLSEFVAALTTHGTTP